MALGHPKGLFPLFFTEMWERLAFYTMLGVLLLYTTDIAGGGADGLVAISTLLNTVIGIADTPFPVPHNIVLTPDGRKIYVTHSGATADKVSVYRVSFFDPDPTLVTTVDAGLNPFGLAFVP